VDKAPDAFRTISEAAQELDVPQHVLRFWESRFREIKPLKRGGGRRYYRPEDVDLLRGIRHLLYGEGYTIRGVQRILREQGARFVQDVWHPGAVQPDQRPSDDAGEEAALPSAQPKRETRTVGHPRSFSGSGEGDPTPPATRGGLRPDELRKLQAALHELGECRKLLDAALAGHG
jgi:DNA-binding transcriptional MerR regulator